VSQSAGEQTTRDDRKILLALLGEVTDQRLLDFGCTDPTIGQHALDRGARHYLGLAGGPLIADAARRALAGTAAEVRLENLNRWSGHDLGRFDAVVSRLALHRVHNLARLLETLHHHLVPGGRLTFSVPHPIATAGLSHPPEHNGAAPLVYLYFHDGERPALSPGGSTDSLPPVWHRRMDSYLRELRYCGFRLDEFCEGLPGTVAEDRAPTVASWPASTPWAVFRCAR
jgi:SAM-dependent methyltransferase